MNTAEPEPAAAVRINHLVVGVDGSPESLHALDLAAVLGGPHRATLTIVHVHPRPPSLSYSPAAATEYDRAEAEIDEVVKSGAQRSLHNYPGDWSVIRRRGNVTHELLEAADVADADIIVVGHRSNGPLQDAILGSVAASTVHRSRRTIIVAIPPQRDHSTEDDDHRGAA